MCKDAKKNAETDSSGSFICKDEKKTTETDSSGVFICKSVKKKMPKLIVSAFLYIKMKKIVSALNKVKNIVIPNFSTFYILMYKLNVKISVWL